MDKEDTMAKMKKAEKLADLKQKNKDLKKENKKLKHTVCHLTWAIRSAMPRRTKKKFPSFLEK